MNKRSIKNVLLCGLGGVGCLIASRIKDSEKATLKVLLDGERYQKYKATPTTFNLKEYYFDYTLPSEENFNADLIIIATKDDGLDTAVKNIKNFITDNTIIISILNGIHSERKIAKVYGWENVLISFYIGNSCIREGRNIKQEGNYTFYIGERDNKNSEKLKSLSNFFQEMKINHNISENILGKYWEKFMINVGLNQVCCKYNLTYKEIREKPSIMKEMKELIYEVKLLAEKEGIKSAEEIFKHTMDFLINDFKDATPSMLQDIRCGRKTEVEIFAGEVTRLGKKHNIQTPKNKKIYKEIKKLEEIKN